ncbi:MAG TPA: hypothetical protein VN903_12680, partial [Polyangia bacterium]|nr:hypothetical protein [Polyangia bacterium]
MNAAAIVLVALVADDPATLRNAPRDDAPPQATLWRGDWLEVRGETAGFLRVYDHRHERPGYIRPTIVRVYRLDAASTPELAAVVRFLRDSNGNESLGIGYAALALRAAPAGSDTSEILAAIGTMADRLARRASATRADTRNTTLTAHIDVAESYGVKFKSVEVAATGNSIGSNGPNAQRTRLCYDGEAWEGVLAARQAVPIERARAALFLAARSCQDRTTLALEPAEARAWNDRRVQALQSIEYPVENALPPALLGRVRLRRAEAFAWRAFDEARRGNFDPAARAEAAAVRELALTDRGVLAPEDVELYEDVAVRVAASRWATEPEQKPAAKRTVDVVFAPRDEGETCVRVVQAGGGKARTVGERCTYGLVWRNALRWAPSGSVATVAVQPLAAWTEVWVLRRGDDASWTIETLTPATADPDSAVGYVEAAGFSPDGGRLLVVREARAGAQITRRFQVIETATLVVERWAAHADKLGAFKRWSSPS